MEKKIYELRIDPEMERVAPPLAKNELEILKADILEHGCKIPLIVWDGVIVDGHNRYRICTEADIPFGIEEMEFDSLTDAKLWIVRNQLGRRNLKDFQRCEMVYPFESELKAKAKEHRIDVRKGKAPKLADGKDTRDVLANMAGVSHGTYEKAKIIITEGDEESKDLLRRGKAKIHTVYMRICNERQAQKKDDAKRESDVPTPREHAKAGPAQEEEPSSQEPVPLVHLDEPIEVPYMRDPMEKDPQPFNYVQDQVRFAMTNMIKNLEIAVSWLRDEDADKIEILLTMLNRGFEEANALLRGQEGEQ